jgi:hypothetical protein
LTDPGNSGGLHGRPNITSHLPTLGAANAKPTGLSLFDRPRQFRRAYGPPNTTSRLPTLGAANAKPTGLSFI